MNELEIIRSQLAVEQSHAAEVTHACAAVFGSSGAAAAPSEATSLFREACVSYLVWVLARFEERDQTLSELLASHPPPPTDRTAASARHLSDLVGRAGTSREALSRLEEHAGENEDLRQAVKVLSQFNHEGALDNVPFDSVWNMINAVAKSAG